MGDSVREVILSEIKRLADANGGKPPGSAAFTTATGITMGKWRGVYWARWSDALAEAGYSPNEMQGRLNSEAILRKVAELARLMGKLPSYSDMRLRRRSDPSFPNDTTIANHFGAVAELVTELRRFCQGNEAYADVVDLLPAHVSTIAHAVRPSEGWVYLLKSGHHYKVGRSDQLESRVKKISIALPEATALVHAIRTDDPPGIEAYWHRRFADRRANGEWFKLTAVDVAAFTRRKFQ